MIRMIAAALVALSLAAPACADKSRKLKANRVTCYNLSDLRTILPMIEQKDKAAYYKIIDAGKCSVTSGEEEVYIMEVIEGDYTYIKVRAPGETGVWATTDDLSPMK